MSDLEVVLTCPLGSECEKIIDNKIHRCRWYVELEGLNPNTGDPLKSQNCAIAWEPIILLENSQKNAILTSGVNQLRNEINENTKTGAMATLSLCEAIENSNENSRDQKLIESRS